MKIISKYVKYQWQSHTLIFYAGLCQMILLIEKMCFACKWVNQVNNKLRKFWEICELTNYQQPRKYSIQYNYPEPLHYLLVLDVVEEGFGVVVSEVVLVVVCVVLLVGSFVVVELESSSAGVTVDPEGGIFVAVLYAQKIGIKKKNQSSTLWVHHISLC